VSSTRAAKKVRVKVRFGDIGGCLAARVLLPHSSIRGEDEVGASKNTTSQQALNKSIMMHSCERYNPRQALHFDANFLLYSSKVHVACMKWALRRAQWRISPAIKY
jgi:hypothetical protein